MRILIAEDDVASGLLLRKLLEPYGICYVASNGKEAVETYRLAHQKDDPFALVCLDVMMPEMDGVAALRAIRNDEEDQRLPPSRCAKIVMATAMRDRDTVTRAYRELCDGYLVKPIERDKLLALLTELNLLPLSECQLASR